VKKVLVDVNVVLDVLLDREPHVGASAAVWAAVERGQTKAVLSAHAVTTIHYLLRRELGISQAKKALEAVLRVFGVAMVDESVIQDALDLPFGDFEDAVTAAAARMAGCGCVVTRDPGGFRGSPVRALTPEAAVHLFATLGGR